MNLPERIVIQSDVMMGNPCIRGSRIPVFLLRQKLAAGETAEEILRAYSQLMAADLQACLAYASLLAAEEVVLTGTCSGGSTKIFPRIMRGRRARNLTCCPGQLGSPA